MIWIQINDWKWEESAVYKNTTQTKDRHVKIGLGSMSQTVGGQRTQKNDEIVKQKYY